MKSLVAKHERRVAAKQTGQGELVVPEPSAPKAAKVTKLKATKKFGQTVPKAAKPIIHKEAIPSKPTSSQPPKPKPASTKPSKADPKKKQKLVKETPNEPSPAKRSKGGLVGKRRKPTNLLRITMTNSETESDEVVTPVNKEKDASYRELTEINTRVQDEGQVGSNLGKQDEGQARSNPGNAVEFQPQPSHVVHVGPNLEPMDLEKNLKLPTEDQEEELEKTNAELEVQSMVTVPIQQDTSSVPPMTTPQQPPQPRQSATDLILLHRIGELEQHMANLIQDNLDLAERLNKHGSRLYNLENLNIPQKVNKAVDEIFTDAVDWALQASLHHKNLYEALEKSMDRDHSDQLQADLAEVLKKHRKRSNSPRTPSGSPPPPPPPPPHSLGASRALGSSQLPPPLPSSSFKPADFDKSKQQKNDSGTLDSIKLPVATHQSSAWTISDTRDKPLGSYASALATTYQATENSLLEKTGDMQTFMNWYCQKIDLANPEGDQVSIDISIPLPLSGLPGHVTIQTQFFFNKHLDYLRYGSKGSGPALLISKMNDARYPDFGLELLIPEQMWINDTRNLVIRHQVENLQLGIESDQK
uniref:Uncharacterized protein n=1 Tax=Tanacetum cinerariifolium TaxID=118510 RepID=A0A6L2JG86_TANCI|nr:hypothetical protein [Tanacetum cinerariifolium]